MINGFMLENVLLNSLIILGEIGVCFNKINGFYVLFALFYLHQLSFMFCFI